MGCVIRRLRSPMHFAKTLAEASGFRKCLIVVGSNGPWRNCHFSVERANGAAVTGLRSVGEQLIQSGSRGLRPGNLRVWEK